MNGPSPQIKLGYLLRGVAICYFFDKNRKTGHGILQNSDAITTVSFNICIKKVYGAFILPDKN